MIVLIQADEGSTDDIITADSRDTLQNAIYKHYTEQEKEPSPNLAIDEQFALEHCNALLQMVNNHQDWSVGRHLLKRIDPQWQEWTLLIIEAPKQAGKKEDVPSVVANTDEAWKIQETYKDKAHGWLQWKATNVFIEIRCICGETSDFDGYFMYAVQCPYCKRIYMANEHIQLIEVAKCDNFVVAEADLVTSE
jgi:hypothetical protein